LLICNLCDLSVVCLFTDNAITESHQRAISPNLAIVLPACQNSWAAWGTIQLLGELYLLAFGAVMLTSKEYLQQAEDCSQLACACSDVNAKEALIELAYYFKAMAKDLEQRNERSRETVHGLDGKRDGMKTIA
jgi:hypothetical protein